MPESYEKKLEERNEELEAQIEKLHEKLGDAPKDFLGNVIHLGDTVVFIQLKYRNLLKGTVVKITPKTVLIVHDKTNVCSTETKQFHNQVVVIKTNTGEK